jgi:hypothetical protein
MKAKNDSKLEANDYFNAILSPPLMNQSSSKGNGANLSNSQLLNHQIANKRSLSQVRNEKPVAKPNGRRPKSNLEGIAL